MKAASTLNWRLLDLCTAAAFLVFLLAPAIDFAVQHDSEPVNLAENRRSEPFPELPKTALEWAAWPRGFEAWHDDHFGLRTTLLRNHSRLKVFGFDTSPSSQILVGREHWVFGTGPGVDLWRGSDPFTLGELEAWRRCLESRQRELAKRNIAYYCVIAPGKAEIYPEFLPSQIRKGGPSRTDQLALHLEKTSTFRIIDLRAALLAEKQNDVGDDYAYYPLGIHWTQRGALAGSRAIVAELAKQYPEVSQVDDTVAALRIAERSGDTWAGRMYIPDLLKQTVRDVSFRDRPLEALRMENLVPEKRVSVDQDDTSLPRAVVFHDSFGEYLVEMLGRHFSHSTFVWRPDLDLSLIERESPNIVIQVFNDRGLATSQPQEIGTGDSTRLQLAFEASHEVAMRVDIAANSPQVRNFRAGSVTVRGADAAARLACKMETLGGSFLLPAFKLRAGTHAVLRVEMESPIPSTANVWFQTKAAPSYGRARQLEFTVQQGANVFYVELVDPDLTGELLLRPARETGTFLISALEARLVPN